MGSVGDGQEGLRDRQTGAGRGEGETEREKERKTDEEPN